MKIQKILVFLCLLTGISISAKAQKWLESVRSEQPTLQEVQTAFNDYWRGKTIEKGKGYKQFKRWEWLMSTRLMPDGTLPPSDITTKNYNTYLQDRPASTNRLMATPNWVFSGPTNSPGGYNGLGRINCIGFHPTDVNTFWVGTPAGGLWKTINGGASWTTVTDNLPVLGVSDIAIDPTNTNVMYIATGDGDAALALSAQQIYAGDTKSIGILKSTDGGNTWNTTGLSWSVTAAKLIRRLIINPANPQILVAATSDGIYRTTNGGANWTQVQTGYFMDLEFKPGDPNIVYASSNGSSTINAQIYRSTNGGASWASVISLPNVRRMNIAVTPNSPSQVDVLCCNLDGGLAGLWYSNNSGASFSQYFNSNNSNNLLHNSYNASGAGGQGYYDLAYAISPINANEIWLGGVNLWKSTNGGTNWNLATMWSPNSTQNPNSAPVTHADKHFLAFHPLASGTLFDCNDGGLYKTTNGGTTWSDLSNGLGISQLYRIGTSATIANNVIMGLQDNGTKEFYNNSFLERTGGDGMECIIDYTNANIKYSSYVNGRIYKTTDGGTTWSTIVGNEGTGVNSSGEWITPYVMHPTNNSTLLIGKTQVYRSTNGGTNWSQLGTLSGATGLVIALAYAPSNPQIIYASTRTQIYKTTNGGESWTLLNGLTASTTPNTYIAVNPTNPDLLYVTQGGYTANDKVWTVSSTNAPMTGWQNISGSLPNVPVNCIVYQKGTNDAIYVGTDVGVFYRDASLTDWTEFNSELPRVIVTELEISYNNNKLWAATFGRGLWSSNLCYINVTALGATTFCDGGSVTLSSTATSGNQWYRDGTLITGATNPTYTATTAGAYAVSSTSWGACSNTLSNTIPVTIQARPAANITSVGPTTFCTGSNVVLQANSGTGLTYQWRNNGVPISGATSSSYIATVAGSYTVVVTNSSNCSSTSNATIVTVNILPTTPSVVASGSVTFCQGGSVNLTSSSSNGNQWYNNGTLISGATASTYTATATGVYTVITTTGSCSSLISNAVTVTVNALPLSVITAAGPTSFCSGGSVVLNANTGTGLTYQWKKDGINISGATTSRYTATNAGSYTVVVSNSSNCSSTSNATIVTVNNLPPTPTVLASGATFFCQGGSVILTSSSSNGNQWYNNGTLISGATASTYTATATGLYTVITTTGSCASLISNAVTVTVNASPSSVITAAGPTTFCIGGSVVLIANQGTGFTYQWKKDGTDISGATASSFTATVAGSYTVLVTNSSNCSSTSNAIIVTIGSIPATPSISWNGTQFSTSATGVTYQWYLNGNAISGATSSTYIPNSIGIYKVMITSNGCSISSDNYTLVVTGIDPTLILSPYTAQVYPNPAKNGFAIKFSETPNVTLDIQLINNLGVILKSIKTKSNLTTIKVNEFPSGTYFIKIIGGSYNQVKKIDVIK